MSFLVRADSVMASSGSYPAMTSKTFTASVTVRAIGPPMSFIKFNGTMPERLVKPMVERMPTRSLCDEGPRIEFPVSVPRPAVERIREIQFEDRWEEDTPET